MVRARQQVNIEDCYQRHVVEESNKRRTWTVPRLQNAIKAAFFGRSVESATSEEEISLRYSDLKSAVSASEGPVADRTLSRALADLVSRGHLQREPRGREVLYRLSIPRVEKLAAFAKSDADAIRFAAQVGGIADLSEGWAYYGIPEFLHERLRGRLRRAGLAHRKAIGEVVDQVVDETLRSVVRRGRGRLSRETLWKVEDGLYATLEPEAIGWLALARGQIVWSNIETLIPGALAAWRRAIGVEGIIPKGPPTIDSQAQFWSRVLQVPAVEIRKVLERELKRIERYRPVLDQFFAVLSPEERGLVARDLNGLIVLIANLTAVTRP